MPQGLVLRQHLPEFTIVSAYYDAAKFEPTKRGPLPIDRTDVFDSTFLNLAEQILAYRRSHVVVVAHGSPERGLIMPIAERSRVSAGYCIPRLADLVDQVSAVNGDVDRLDARAVADAVSDWRTNRAKVLRLVATCYAIRTAEDIAVAVHIRGCNIGQQLAHLRAMRRLFNALVVSAPVCGMFFTRVGPNVVAADTYAGQHRPQGRRFVYRDAALHPLLLDVSFEHHQVRAHSAIEVRSDIRGWANVMYNTLTSTVTNEYPIAGLYPPESTRYFLAHQTEDYTGLLAAVRD